MYYYIGATKKGGIVKDKTEKTRLTRLLLRKMALTGMNQEELAVAIGVKPATISNWLSESGHGITAKNQELIKFFCRDVIAEEKSVQQKKIEDPLLSEINDVWDRLSKSERGDVYRYVFATLEKSGCGVQPKNVVNGD